MGRFISMVENIRLMEGMTFTLQLQEGLGKKRWRTWTSQTVTTLITKADVCMFDVLTDVPRSHFYVLVL